MHMYNCTNEYFNVRFFFRILENIFYWPLTQALPRGSHCIPDGHDVQSVELRLTVKEKPKISEMRKILRPEITLLFMQVGEWDSTTHCSLSSQGRSTMHGFKHWSFTQASWWGQSSCFLHLTSAKRQNFFTIYSNSLGRKFGYNKLIKNCNKFDFDIEVVYGKIGLTIISSIFFLCMAILMMVNKEFCVFVTRD